MPHQRFLIIVLACLSAACSMHDAIADPYQFDYRQIQLDNGLTVISLEDHSCPVVAVHLWYHVGSKDEHPERQGFAHMFEHMMFRGTDRLGSTDHFDFIRRTGGDCNAYTSFDQTVYTQTLPSNQLELAFWLEAERMSMLKIDQKSFDTERKVVEEERRLGVNQPYGTLMEEVLPVIFPGHPYQWAPIGSIPHLRSATCGELRTFWTSYYVPNNATLIVVGDVTHDQVQSMARKYFGWIPRCVDPDRVTRPAFTSMEKQSITLKAKNAPAPVLAMAFRGVPLDHDDSMAIDLMTTILGGGESSRLYRRVVAEDELAVFAGAGALSLEQNGAVGAFAMLSPLGGKPDQALAAIEEEIKRLQTEPVTDAEFNKAKNQKLRSLVTANLSVSSKASVLGQAAVLEGDVSRVNERLAKIQALSREDIQRVARQYLDLDHAMTGRVKRNLLGTISGLLGFGKEEEAPITGEPETNPPSPGRTGVVRPAAYPQTPPQALLVDYDPSLPYQSGKLENGMVVYVVENHELPFVSVSLGLTGGAWTEAKPGSASMALSMLTKGTKNYDEAALAEELDARAISISGSASIDTSSVSMSCLTDQLGQGMALLGEVVLRPTMPEDEFRKLKKQKLTALAVATKEPSYLADRELRRRLYGKHPYARSAEGEPEDVKALTVEDARDWWNANARPAAVSLIFAGDVTLDRAMQLTHETFGAWKPAPEAAEIHLAEIPARQDTRIYLVDHMGVQSQIRVGQLAFTRNDPDYYISRVVSGYFGGAFSSRLNETIRVKKGLTYGARGGFSTKRMAGEFQVNTFSKNKSTVEAVAAILAEINRLQQEPPAEKELGNTKSYLVGSFPSDRETPQQVASELWTQRYMGLPDDFDAQLLAAVDDCTAQHCLTLANKRVDPDRLTIVVVGPAKQLQAELEKIATVTVVKD